MAYSLSTLVSETDDFVAEISPFLATKSLFLDTKSPVSGDKVACLGNKCGHAISRQCNACVQPRDAFRFSLTSSVQTAAAHSYNNRFASVGACCCNHCCCCSVAEAAVVNGVHASQRSIDNRRRPATVSGSSTAHNCR